MENTLSKTLKCCPRWFTRFYDILSMEGRVSMSDKKLDLILSEIQNLRADTNKRFDRNEEMIQLLFKF
jgi:hypothetical protein